MNSTLENTAPNGSEGGEPGWRLVFGEATDERLALAAAMHIEPSINVGSDTMRGPKYRFSLDKLRLFRAFDPESFIFAITAEGKIGGLLVYTHSEPAFNRFAKSITGGFPWRVVKTAFGYYGFEFRKFLKAFRSATGAVPAAVSAPAAAANGDFGKIWVLIVATETRRMGIAAALVEAAAAAMRAQKRRELRVTVKTDNAPAIKVYEKSGFKIIGTTEESSGPSHVMSRQP